MSEAERDEGQKTVVAFIAGLLIGGLLVWVFSSTPENGTSNATTGDSTNTEETRGTEDTNVEATTATNGEVGKETVTTAPATTVAPEPSVAETGEITVANQPAGDVVELSDVVFPGNAGWIAVRDERSVLGAARYNLTDGLIPNEVELLRATEAGNSYYVLFYTDNGDRAFNTATDFEVDGTQVTFTAR